MKIKSLVVLIVFFTLALTAAKEPKMKKIFNGKNLKGWVEPEITSGGLRQMVFFL